MVTRPFRSIPASFRATALWRVCIILNISSLFVFPFHFLSEFTQEEEIGLATHNEFRQIHQVPAMTLDRQMCDKAEEYAQKLAQMGTLQHASQQEREGNGENLSMGCSTNQAQTMEEAVTNW